MRSVTKEDAYNAGKDAALNGSNPDNCDIVFFASRDLTAEWEKGNSDGLKEKYKLNNNNNATDTGNNKEAE